MTARQTDGTTWRAVVKRCPFITAIGPDTGARTPRAMARAATRTLAILGGDPEPLDPITALELTEVLASGGTILVMADRADLRDAAKVEIGRLCTLIKTGPGGHA